MMKELVAALHLYAFWLTVKCPCEKIVQCSIKQYMTVTTVAAVLVYLDNK
jgi:hypothetical protein